MTTVSTIEGIGEKQAGKLREAGIRTCERLLEAGGTRKGRRDLADETGISEKLVLEWVNRADLLRIDGVGRQYSDLLEAAGVDTVKELARRNPENLATAMRERNEQGRNRLVQRPPSATMVAGWVEQAGGMPAAVSH